MPIVPHLVREARVDYCTATVVDGAKRQSYNALGYQLVRSAVADGYDASPFRWKGYDGETAGWATAASRDDSALIRLSGAKSDEWFDILYLAADHITRLDLCVTVQTEEENGNIAQSHADSCERWKAETGRTLGTTLYVTNGQPTTLYLGQRVSDIYGRIYNKSVESPGPDYQRCWRYEIEAKGRVASRLAATLHSRPNRTAYCLAAVRHYFARRGVEPVFEPNGHSLHIQTVRPKSDVDSRLNWLATQVRPAVQWLLGRGLHAEVSEALGLPRTLTEQARMSYWLDHDHHAHEIEGDENEGTSDA